MIEQLKRGAFRSAGRLGACNVRDTIVVAGSPRSGTTWLLELLCTLPGYKAMNEPLMYEEARREHGFSWRTYLDPSENATPQQEYLHAILTGQLGISPAWHFESTSRSSQLLEHATRRKLIVKFCRLNRMLHWFATRFTPRGLLFIVRHPCAVVASMLRHGGWSDEQLSRSSLRNQVEKLDEELPDSLRDVFEPIIDRIETKTQMLATLWCLDHYVPLHHHAEAGFPWVLAPYERLVTRGTDDLDRIAGALDIEVTPEMQDSLRSPSSSVTDQLHRDAEKQLSKWRRKLSEEQIDRILQIVEQVGLSRFYTNALEPNYDRLNRCQSENHRW
jgi:hypothetical protein